MTASQGRRRADDHELGHVRPSGEGITFGPMGTRRTEKRLTQVSGRLRDLRDELSMIDEQLAQLVDEAEDLALRALVSETPSATHESNDARKHVDAMRRHRDHVVNQITELEARQDELLDQLTGRPG
jgi:chromosome segregation ATPase